MIGGLSRRLTSWLVGLIVGRVGRFEGLQLGGRVGSRPRRPRGRWEPMMAA